jgi:hypothetical protein
LISGTIVLAIRAHTASYSIAQQIAGLITSYRMLEVHRLISLFLFALILLTVASMRTLSTTSRVIIGLLASFFSFTFFYNRLPIAIIWIIVALLKMAILRKWSLALLIVFTAPLPLGLPFGSPTYAIYAMFAGTLALPWAWEELERKINFPDMKTVLLFYGLALLLVVPLRNGINLPIISSFANPLLAEKEKTYQLKEIMDWVLASNYRDCKVLLHHDKYSPAYSPSQAIARTHIPPTAQMYVDEYMEMMRGPLNNQRARTTNLIVTFGNEGLPGMRLLKSLDGRWAGRASIFVSPPEQERHASVQ